MKKVKKYLFTFEEIRSLREAVIERYLQLKDLEVSNGSEEMRRLAALKEQFINDCRLWKD